MRIGPMKLHLSYEIPRVVLQMREKYFVVRVLALRNNFTKDK